MTYRVFPDNTVLCNFAAVDRLDLLELALDERGRWVEAVADEARRSARHLPALSRVADDGWLGDPIEIEDPIDVDRVERVRRSVFGGTDDSPLQHLGEAQTCHLLLNRPELAGSWWVSDDREALTYARRQGITTRETIDIVRGLAINGDLIAASGHQLLLDMETQGRHLRMSASPADLLR